MWLPSSCPVPPTQPWAPTAGLLFFLDKRQFHSPPPLFYSHRSPQSRNSVWSNVGPVQMSALTSVLSHTPYTHSQNVPPNVPNSLFFFFSQWCIYISSLTSCVTESNNWLTVPLRANDRSDCPCCAESETVATDDINLLPLIFGSLAGSSTVSTFASFLLKDENVYFPLLHSRDCL